MLTYHLFQENACVLEGALKLEIAFFIIILDCAPTTTTLGVVKGYGSIALHKKIGKNNGENTLGTQMHYYLPLTKWENQCSG